MLLVTAGWVAASCGMPSTYEGDGQLIRLKRFPGAYEVRLDPFFLDQPYTHQFSLRGLPRSNYEYTVGLTVEPDQAPRPRYGEEGLKIPGTVDLVLSGKKDQRRLACEMSQLYWRWMEGEAPFGFVPVVGSTFYQADQVFDAVTIRYRPGKGSPPLRARVVVKCDISRL